MSFMERCFFHLSVISKRISDLLEPAINRQFWVKAEIASGRECGGAFYCDLVNIEAGGKLIAKVARTIRQRDLNAVRGLFTSKGRGFKRRS